METRINHIQKIRAGTETCNEDICEMCNGGMSVGGAKICFDDFVDSLCICQKCAKINKVKKAINQ